MLSPAKKSIKSFKSLPFARLMELWIGLGRAA
jgi:hypothetical protein